MNRTFFAGQALNLFKTLFMIKRITNLFFFFFYGRTWHCWSKKRMWTSWQSSSPMNISMSSTVSSGSWTQTTTSTSTRETWRSTTTKVLHHIFRTALLPIHEIDPRCGADACTKHHWSFLGSFWHLQQPEAVCMRACMHACICVCEREGERAGPGPGFLLTLSERCILDTSIPSAWLHMLAVGLWVKQGK